MSLHILNRQPHIKNFLNRAVKDMTPGSFTSRGQDDANLRAMFKAAKILGFDGVEWYRDCHKWCLENSENA